MFLWQWGSCACDKGDQPLCAQLFRRSCADRMGLITLLSVPVSVVTCSTFLGSWGGSVLGTSGSLVSKSPVYQAWLLTTHPDLPHTRGYRTTLSQEFWFYTKVLPTWLWSSHLVLSGTHWLVFPLVFGLSQPEVNDSDVAWVTYILHYTFKDCQEFCLRAPNLEHLVPTSGIPNKPATYEQAFSHRKQRSCSEIRSITVLVLWPRACLLPKPRVLALWAWGCVWSSSKLLLWITDSSFQPSLPISFKTVSYSGLLSKPTNPPASKNELCHAQVFKTQDLVDGATCLRWGI